MKERPIIFSGNMVLAILEGRKTQTRRVVRELPGNRGGPVGDHVKWFERGVEDPTRWCGHDGLGSLGWVRCPYGVPGDRLWVRETWCLAHPDYHNERDRPPGQPVGDDGRWCFYRATDPDVESADKDGASPWRSPIFMPRWASRITLEVTGVRVERVQDISEEDARAEGVAPFPLDLEGDCWTDGTHRTAYNFLWNEINGWNPNSWVANPWVWCISFRVVSP